MVPAPSASVKPPERTTCAICEEIWQSAGCTRKCSGHAFLTLCALRSHTPRAIWTDPRNHGHGVPQEKVPGRGLPAVDLGRHPIGQQVSRLSI
jgi:hypothetical protein